MKTSSPRAVYQPMSMRWVLLCMCHLFMAPAWAENFVLYSNYPLGEDAGPNNVVVADVNNDKRPDLVCANDGLFNSKNTVTVLTNAGNGLFISNNTYTVGYKPYVAVADIRGVGRPDLITANFADSTLSILTNNGSGRFEPGITIPEDQVGNGPYNFVVTDINHDGYLDLVVADNGTNFDGSTLIVLTNNGAGVFGSNAIYNVGNLPTVAAADLRGTGYPDLISANYGDNTLTVLTNNGHGVFGFNASYDVGEGPINVIAANFNQDSNLDLVCANSNTNTLTVLTNSGGGIFTTSATIQAGNVSDFIYYVTAADVNGDGKIDLIAADYNNASLSVLTNDGSGVFAYYASYPVRNSPISVTAADVNKDGRSELISVNYGDASITVRLELPQLDLKLSNNLSVVSWQPNWSNYVLQTTANLAVANGWTNVFNPTQTNAIWFQNVSENRFFRLRHP